MSYPKEQIAHPYCIEEALTRSYGSHPLAFFGLAPENLHFLAPDGEGLINYRLTGNVAVVLGDPICPPQAVERVIRSFLEFCTLHKWHIAFYQVYPHYLALYRSLKLRAFKMGEEAILNPQTFTLHGSALANVRTSSRRAEREGVSIQWYEGTPPTEMMHQLEQLSNAWLMRKTGKRTEETGFSVGRFDELATLAELADTIATLPTASAISQDPVPRFWTVVAVTNAGRACAFMTFTPIYGCISHEVVLIRDQVRDKAEIQDWGWTLDMIRRAPDAPPGVIELLLVQAIERFRLSGATIFSLGLVAWADTNQEMTRVQRQLASFVTDRLHLLETHHTLFKFKQKFNPSWQSRYVVTHATLALP